MNLLGLQYNINDLFQEAKKRWLKPIEVFYILQNHDVCKFTEVPVNQPRDGSVHLFNKRVMRFFRKDGHNWRKKKDGRTVAEGHERLKVGNVEALNCYYAHGAENRSFRRRSYWMLNPEYEHVVLVHYRETNEGTPNSSPVNQLSTFSRSHNSYTPQNPDTTSIARDSWEPNQNFSSPPGYLEVTPGIMNNGMDHLEKTEAQALRQLEEQLSLHEDSFKETFPFYSEHEIPHGISVAFSGPDDHKQPYEGYNGAKDGSANHYHELLDHDCPGGQERTLSWTEMLETCKCSSVRKLPEQHTFEASEHEKLLSSSGREMIANQEISYRLNPNSNNNENSVFAFPQDVSGVKKFQYSSVETQGTTSDYYERLFGQCQIQEPRDPYACLTIEQKQKFKITAVSPEYCYATEATKVFIIGSFLCPPSDSTWGCMFGDVEVPAEMIQDGVMCCEAPSNLLGKVTLCITSGNKEPCSEIKEFEFRSKTSSCAHCNILETEAARSPEELLLLVQFAEMLLSASTMRDDSTESGSLLSTEQKVDDDSWSHIRDAILVGNGTSSGTIDWLLQELLKDKLQHWLSCRSNERDEREGCSLSWKEQGIIHMVSGLGFQWALNPILSYGVVVNFRDINGWTALHWAARFGREKMAASLIAAGASAGAVTDPSSQDPNGLTAASIAISNGHKGLAGYLAEADLTSHLSSLTLEKCEVSEIEAELTVSNVSNKYLEASDDEVSLKKTLGAVRNAAQAAALIQAAFRALSFRRRKERESARDYRNATQAAARIQTAYRAHSFRKRREGECARDYNSAKKVVGSISRLVEKRENCNLDSMDIAYIDISSSDDDLEILDDHHGRILPDWAASERNSDSRRANGSNASSSNNFRSLVRPHNRPGPSNGNTSQHQTVNSRISNSHGTDYEKISSQQALKRTLPSSFQSSETRAFPPSSFAPNNRVSNLSSSQLNDAYRSRHHGVGPSTSGEKGFFRDNFGRGNDGDRFMNQNGGTRALPPSLMLGKSITPPFATSSESAYRSGVGDERAPETDERLIYEAALQDISQPLKEADLPAGIMAVPLMRHQKIALAWMLQRENRSLHCLGGILADDQGLGKTISTIALILMQRESQIKWKTDDTFNHKAEALNLDDEDDDANGSIDVEKLKKDEESNDTKPMIEPSSSTRAPSRKRPAAGTLVVCPASVLRQWARELEEKVGDEKLSVLIFHGGSRTKDPVELAKYDVVLTTYSLVTNEVPKQPIVEDDDIDEKDGENFGLSSDFCVKKKRKKTYNGSKKGKKGKKGIDGCFDPTSGALAKVGWFRVILDEAQTIKNHRTQMARACSSLRAKRRWCLSGTPIQNTIDDLYSYFRFLKYDPYAVYKSFYTSLKVPISRNSIQGYKKLQAVLRAIMLRRTKGTLLDGKPIITLPPKTINLSKVDFSYEERAFYKKLEADSRSQFKAYAAAGTVNQNYANILLMLLRLRQACDHPLLVKEYYSDPVGKDSVEMAKRLPKEMLINLFHSLETTAAICCVCNDPPDDAVISMCGHVFCYQCVSEHLTGDENMCPANHCKEQIGEDLVFSKATLRSCISDDPSGSSSGSSSLIDHSIVQNSDYSSSKIKAVLEVLQSSCRLKVPSGNRDSPPSDDSDIEDFDSDVKVTKVTTNFSECTTGGPLKAIIFSQWTSMLDLVETSMAQSGIKYRRLDGRMTLTARDRAVKDFNTDPEITVMLMSLKAGNLGLNMVSACHVILLDLWWNPTTEDQAIDRAHRIGQTRPVTVTRITIKDTVEDRILALQDEKRKMVASAFGEDHAGGSGTRLTVDDLKYLFMV